VYLGAAAGVALYLWQRSASFPEPKPPWWWIILCALLVTLLFFVLLVVLLSLVGYSIVGIMAVYRWWPNRR
jgi:hypothetical protein